MLTPKNMHALRTLFNIAHVLHPVLGGSWILVLENLNSLDRILNSPRTTTQACAQPHAARGCRLHPLQPSVHCRDGSCRDAQCMFPSQ